MYTLPINIKRYIFFNPLPLFFNSVPPWYKSRESLILTVVISSFSPCFKTGHDCLKNEIDVRQRIADNW